MASTGSLPSGLLVADSIPLYQSAATLGVGTVVSDSRPCPDYTNAEFTLNCTAITTGTLDVYIQRQVSSGDWTDVYHFTQLSATGKRWVHIQPQGMTADSALQDAALAAATYKGCSLGDTIRVKGVVAGASPACTFTVTATFYA